MSESPPRVWRPRLRWVLFAAVSTLLTAGAANAQRDDAAASYRQILEQWANGSRRQAVLDLATLEQQWMADLNELQRLQVQVLTHLVKSDHRSLVAAARLHQEAYRLPGESPLMGPRAIFDLQVHAMLMNDQAVRLSVKYRKRIPEIRRHAAILLTSMAGLLYEDRFLEAANQRLNQAIVLDPELAVAFEWGGTAEEQLGRLGRSARLLWRLIELEPDNYHGRLRLAMVEAKLGSGKARGLLEGIVLSEHRSWVWIFAVQELARDDASSGRENDAIDLLHRALVEYPDDQGLAVALAFLERGHRGRSRATLEALESRGALESARVHYSGWPRREAFDSVVETMLLEHLPHLGKALGSADEERQ